MRHLVADFESGLWTNPKSVAELGPGDSLGVGLAALVSGVEKYDAFDVVKHAQVKRNEATLDELVALFRQRAAIPGQDELPEVRPNLASYAFPSHILTETILAAALEESRLRRIRESVMRPNVPGCDDRLPHALLRRKRRRARLDRSAVSRRRCSSMSMTCSAPTAPCASGSNRAACSRTRSISLSQHGPRLERPLEVLGPDLDADPRETLLPAQPPALLPSPAAHGGQRVRGRGSSQGQARLTSGKGDLAPRFRQITDDDLHDLHGAPAGRQARLAPIPRPG